MSRRSLTSSLRLRVSFCVCCVFSKSSGSYSTEEVSERSFSLSSAWFIAGMVRLAGASCGELHALDDEKTGRFGKGRRRVLGNMCGLYTEVDICSARRKYWTCCSACGPCDMTEARKLDMSIQLPDRIIHRYEVSA